MKVKKDIEKHAAKLADEWAAYEIFRHNLRLLRHSTGLSPDRLAKALKFKKHYRIYNLEVGRLGTPKLKEIEIIAKYFNVSLDNLLFKKLKLVFE